MVRDKIKIITNLIMEIPLYKNAFLEIYPQRNNVD